MHRLIADKQEEIAAICHRHRVERLEVFGSAARGTDFDPERSDIDFLVEFNSEREPVTLQRYLDMIEDLSSAMARGGGPRGGKMDTEPLHEGSHQRRAGVSL